MEDRPVDYSLYYPSPQFNADDLTKMDKLKHGVKIATPPGGGGSAGMGPTEADRLKHALSITGV